MPKWISLLEDGRYAVYLDNHLLSIFSECAQKFEYRHIHNLALKGSADRSASMWLGLWWSSTMENFYLGMKAYQHGAPEAIEPSDKTIAQAAIAAWIKNDMQPSGKERPTGHSFQEIYQKVFDKFGGPEGAIRMALDYWRHFGENDTRNWTIISTELAFGLGGEVVVLEDEEMILYWCGRPDLVVFEKDLDNLVPVDHKTEEYLKSVFIEKWKPHGQTAGYVWALNQLCGGLGIHRDIDRCVINGGARMVVHSPRNDTPRPRFLRARPHYNPSELLEWRKNTFRKAKRLLRAYLRDEWDRADGMICHLYAGCPYRGLCNQPPGVARESVMKTVYTQIEPWVPFQKLEENGNADTSS